MMNHFIMLPQSLSRWRNFMTNVTFNARRRNVIRFDVSCYIILREGRSHLICIREVWRIEQNSLGP